MKRMILLLALLLLVSCSVENGSNDVQINGDANPEGRLYLGLMIHVEGWDNEVTNEESFNEHSVAVEEMANILEEYNAVGTFEFSPEFIEAAKTWDSDIIQELHDRGHGVGVHADAGYSSNPRYDYDFFVRELKSARVAIDGLVDFEVLHVSGICSKMDWVQAALDAGYKFTTGSVGYCALSMSGDLVPAEFEDCVGPGDCHGSVPEDLIESLDPIRADSGDDWLYSDSGELVIFNPRNVLYSQYEDSTTGSEDGKAEFTSEDLEVSYEDIENALSVVEAGKIKLLYYGWSIGDADLHDKVLLEEWLSKVEAEYVDTGKVEWKSLPDVYLEYIQS